MPGQKLFAVMLGGRAPKANTELHDVVFAAGTRIEDTYDQLLAAWFGDPKSLHIDCWQELDVVDGWRISLHRPASPSCEAQEGEVAVAGSRASYSRRGSENKHHLFFVNLGAYRDGEFAELHACGFYVAASAPEAKQRALDEHFTGTVSEKHKDDLHAVDDLIAVTSVNGLHIALTHTGETSALKPHCAYHIIPKAVIAAYLAKA